MSQTQTTAAQTDTCEECGGRLIADDARGEQTLQEAAPATAAQQRDGDAEEAKGETPQKKITPLPTTKAPDALIDRVLEVIQPNDMVEVRDEYERAMRQWAEQTIDDLNDRFDDENDPLSDVFGGGVLDEAVEAKVEERFEWVLQDLADTTRETLRQDIIEGLDEGENPRQVAERIRKTYDEDFTQWRSETIARTEMLSASNAGTWTAHRESDVVKMRSWLSTRDGNVRPAHQALDRRTRQDPIGVEEPFEYGASSAMHPGDFGVAKLDCNCRCTTVAEFPDRRYSEAQREKMWRRYVKALDDDERRTARTARQAFRAQQDRVLTRFANVFDVQLEDAA